MSSESSANLNISEIEHSAFLGLSKEEILVGLGIDYEALSAEHKELFDSSFNYGLFKGRQAALSALHEQTRQRNGGPIAIEFLKRYAENWKTNPGEADSSTSGSFYINFNDG